MVIDKIHYVVSNSWFIVYELSKCYLVENILLITFQTWFDGNRNEFDLQKKKNNVLFMLETYTRSDLYILFVSFVYLEWKGLNRVVCNRQNKTIC